MNCVCVKCYDIQITTINYYYFSVLSPDSFSRSLSHTIWLLSFIRSVDNYQPSSQLFMKVTAHHWWRCARTRHWIGTHIILNEKVSGALYKSWVNTLAPNTETGISNFSVKVLLQKKKSDFWLFPVTTDNLPVLADGVPLVGTLLELWLRAVLWFFFFFYRFKPFFFRLWTRWHRQSSWESHQGVCAHLSSRERSQSDGLSGLETNGDRGGGHGRWYAERRCQWVAHHWSQYLWEEYSLRACVLWLNACVSCCVRISFNVLGIKVHCTVTDGLVSFSVMRTNATFWRVWRLPMRGMG